MESLEHNSAKLKPDAEFWQVGSFHHAFCEDLNKSHNFKNSNIDDVNL